MSDLISRQAALDAIRDMQAFEDDNGQPYLYLYDVMAVFTDEEELPPIQPDIVRCEECLYRKICSWEKQGAKFCSFAERREVTT